MAIKVCRNCKDRYPACWGSCQKYLDAKAVHEKYKKAREKETVLNDMIDSVHSNGLKYERRRRSHDHK